MNIDEKLGLNKFNIDEENAHILVHDLPAEQAKMLCDICPANLYKMQDGALKFDYAGCLECGTCKMVSFIAGATVSSGAAGAAAGGGESGAAAGGESGAEFACAQESGKLLKQWRVPNASFGVLYRFG